MITLTRKTDYAVIALARLAQDPGGRCSAREIAEQYGAPLPLLMNILKLLAQGHLIRSSRGSRGGYTLATPAREITLKSIIDAVEGPIQLVNCVGKHKNEQPDSGKGNCQLASSCPVRSSLHKVHQRLVDFLDGVTLADVVNNEDPAQQLASLPEVSGDNEHAPADLPGQ